MSERERHLDRLAAECAQAVIRKTKGEKASDVDNLVTKALGVLQENGIYACALFLKSRPQAEKARADVVMAEMLGLLDGLGFGWGQPRSNRAEDVLQYISKKVTADNLERLLLAKETLEQMLIYARYGAKARKAEKGE
ncbi:MAG TPA: hypothetical protein EYH32_10950 [Anaerolineae bacterium]|nr:hypothetical protein [Anaerolineae bacterium]